MDEARVIARAAQGDEDAFELLVLKYRRDVTRTVLFTVSDADVIEDLVQETFLRAFRSLRTFDTTKPFRNWLLTIALNASRSYLRRRIVTLPWSERYDRAVEPQFASDEGAVLQDVLRAMAQLRYRDREILTLHYVNDLTLKQAANLLGIPLGTAKSRLAKALSRLREALQYDGVFEEKEVTEDGRKTHRYPTSPGGG